MAMPKPKPNYLLEITADMRFVESLAPQAGCDDPDFDYNFGIRCKKCKEDVGYELCRNLKGRPFEKPCEFCGQPGSVTLVPGFGKPLTAKCAYESKYSPLMAFEFKGYEPVDFSFDSGWKAESVNGTVFNNVDLTYEYWGKYKYGIPAMISHIDYRFTLLDNDGGRVNIDESGEEGGRVSKDESGEEGDTAHEDSKDDYTDKVDEGNNDFRYSEFEKHEDDVYQYESDEGHRKLNSRYSEFVKHEDDEYGYDESDEDEE